MNSQIKTAQPLLSRETEEMWLKAFRTQQLSLQTPEPKTPPTTPTDHRMGRMTWANIAEGEDARKNRIVKINKPVARQELMETLCSSDIVSKFINQDISLADADELLQVYHYNECDEKSSKDVQETRGVVRYGNELVCKTFAFTPEICCTQEKEIQDLLKPVFSECRFFEAREGAMIRLFCFKNHWYMTTHRRLNAMQSKWGAHATSFGQLFLDAIALKMSASHIEFEKKEHVLDRFCSLLNPRRTYVFLVSNDETNYIVCSPPPQSEVYLLGIFERVGFQDGKEIAGSHTLVSESIDHFPTLIPSLPSHSFKNVSELVDFVSHSDVTETSGIVVYLPNGKQVKISSPLYLKYFQLRGNQPSIRFRYLQLRNQPQDLELFKTLYSSNEQDFDCYEEILKTVAQNIAHAYQIRYVRKPAIYVRLPQPQYFVHEDCRKNKNEMTLQSILKYINTLSATQLNHLIKSEIERN